MNTERIEILKKMFPEIVEDGIVNIDKLKELVYTEKSKEEEQSIRERFGLYWYKKLEQAIKMIHSPIYGTLVPVKKESIDFDTSEHIFIEGENLEVLKILQKSYYGKIKIIYIDPPYNRGSNDFIYNDNFQDNIKQYLYLTGQINADGKVTTSDIEITGRKHAKWLNMMYPRLFFARNLLSDDGLIFVSIDDNEVHHLRCIMDEIFGEENFVATFVRRQNLAGKQDASFFAVEHDYCLCYAKDISKLEVNKKQTDESKYTLEDEHLEKRGKFYLRKMDDDGLSYSKGMDYPIKLSPGQEILIYNPRNKKITREVVNEYIEIWPGGDENDESYTWRWSEDKVKWGFQNDMIVFKKVNGNYKVYFKEYLFVDNELNPRERISPYGTIVLDFPNNNSHQRFKELFDGQKVFDYPKPVDLIKFLINLIPDKNCFVLDFFAGSGTTAQAVLELNNEDGGNRRFILIQYPEEIKKNGNPTTIFLKDGTELKTISDIAKERIRRVIRTNNLNTGFKVFKLSESLIKKSKSLEQNIVNIGGIPTSEEKKIYEEQINITLNSMQEKLYLRLIDEEHKEKYLYEIIVQEGFELNSHIRLENIGNNTFYIVEEKNDKNLYVCFDEEIDTNTMIEIIKSKKNYTNTIFYFLQAAMKSHILQSLISNNINVRTL
ncbi:MAG: site-specific DNA-methyltransferase [Thermovenabulum sp.]|uniref:site-specific DNA-methyltransferase n=1 Tax=Thermovenabulum sp. TaxID=3100335 RepID=UPI003C7C3212